MVESYVYLNPKAPQHIKDFVAEHFSDGTPMSAVFMQEMTGGLADEGPALSNYAAAFLDETGELNLLEPCIPDIWGAMRIMGWPLSWP